MKSDKIVKLIADALRVGRSEGLVVGHKDGYGLGYRSGYEEGHDVGYAEGYERALRDAKVEEGQDGLFRGDARALGWDEGYSAGYEQALLDAKVEEDQDGPDFGITLEDEEVNGECHCPACTDPVAYDRGWKDGFVGETGLDEDMLKNTAYLAGYRCGAADRKDPEREIH
jgi:hypothetical protein